MPEPSACVANGYASQIADFYQASYFDHIGFSDVAHCNFRQELNISQHINWDKLG